MDDERNAVGGKPTKLTYGWHFDVLSEVAGITKLR